MNKVRTVMIDGIGIRTSLSAVEIASLPKVNAELKKENEKLNHYKLLYQKVKERNDKAIEYVEKNKHVIREYTSANSGTKKIYEFCCEPDELLEILKGNNETKE